MLITDLSYLENISDANSISGSGVLVGVSAYAGGVYTATSTNTVARTLGNGGSIAKGRGTAIAIDDDPIAGVVTYGEGDKVIEKTKVHYFKNKDLVVARGFVIAIDRP